MSSIDSLQIHLNSRYATNYNSLSDCYFITQNIEVPTDYQINISVKNAAIPYSFYSVDETNNFLNYRVNVNQYYEVYFEVGNYSIYQWLAHLQNKLPNLVVTYDKIKNKFTFTNSTFSITILQSSTCYEILGFTLGSEYESSLINNVNVLVSNACINLSTHQCVCIASNFISNSINLVNQNKSTILCSIPISVSPNSMITYSAGVNDYKVNIFQNIFSVINIKLLDQNAKLLNLNGCHWSLTLQLDVEKFVE